jgi:transposase-like protein
MTKDNTRPVEPPEPREDARSAADRGAGGSTGGRRAEEGAVPDPEVVPRATRRRFGAAYKLRIVQQADACTLPGELGALLRREGLYSSHLADWRRARDQGQLEALAPKRRGPKPDPARAVSKREQQLEREVARLRKRLETAETIIGVQRKVSRLLGIEMPEASGSDS